MSSTAAPIPPSQFALAIKELPLPNLHFKAAELRNSIAHLVSSNDQLKEFADAGDADCKEAIAENEVVMARMRERIELLKAEVEGRGNVWIEEEEEEDAEGGKRVIMNGVNGTSGADAQEEIRDAETTPANEDMSEQQSRESTRSGRLTDQDLRRMLAARMAPDDAEEEEGVFL